MNPHIEFQEVEFLCFNLLYNPEPLNPELLNRFINLNIEQNVPIFH